MDFSVSKTAAIMAAVFSFSGLSQAQVDVVDAQASTANSSSATPKIGSTNQQAELFYQLQALQQEVLQLRGLVEEQGYQLKRLKQQRLDDYLELDRRISGLSTSAVVVPKAADSSDTSAADVTTSSSANTESALYKAAFGQLKKRKVDEAIKGFNEQLKQYPNGAYAANAHYWLGEIYLLQDKLPQAREWFTKLLNGFPNNRKQSDAKFKLAKVYHLQGDKKKSQSLLNEVVQEKGSAADLAEKYLQQNF